MGPDSTEQTPTGLKRLPHPAHGTLLVPRWAGVPLTSARNADLSVQGGQLAFARTGLCGLQGWKEWPPQLSGVCGNGNIYSRAGAAALRRGGGITTWTHCRRVSWCSSQESSPAIRDGEGKAMTRMIDDESYSHIKRNIVSIRSE